MKPFPKKILLPGAMHGSHEQLHSASDVDAEAGQVGHGDWQSRARLGTLAFRCAQPTAGNRILRELWAGHY